MATSKDIVRRIKSVKSTRKVTKAMELVAAAKMRRATEAVLATRTYANLSWLTILNIAAATSGEEATAHPLLTPRPQTERVCVVLITGNRGLCGGFNANMLTKVVRSVELHKDTPTDFVVMGKKGQAIHRRYGYEIVADFAKEDVVKDVTAVTPVAHWVMEQFTAGTYDKIFVAYTDFVSSLQQVPRVKQLLPIDISAQDEYLGVVGENKAGMSPEIVAAKQAKHFTGHDYTFEPSPRAVLDAMIPRLIEVQLYQALLASNASEHRARMMAMRNATDAADEMVDELTLSYNKVRQAGITAEIAEIAGGAAALQA